MRQIVFIFILMFMTFFSQATVADWKAEESKARALLNQGKVEDAIVLFREIILNADNPRIKREGYYWLSIAYINTKRHDLAESNLEYYLRTYGKVADYYEDALYQRGVNFFLMEKYSESLIVLDSFIKNHPKNKYVSNAYYWGGEVLYALGRFDEAQLYFRVVTDEYPQTLKYEASVYKLRLIEHKKAELVLQNIIKWSHEQYLSIINRYKLNELTLQEALEELRKNNFSSNETELLRQRIIELENALKSKSDGKSSSEIELATKARQLELKAKLLERKEQALKLLEEELRIKKEEVLR